MYSKLAFIVFHVVLGELVTTNNVTSLYNFARILDPLLLLCCGSSQSHNSWKHRDTIINYNTEIINELYKESTLVYPNHSLLIKSLSIFHEGTYECTNDLLVVTRYVLDVKVSPVKLFLSVAGVIIERVIRAAKGDELSVTCHALGSLPKANLSWRINEERVNFLSNYSSSKNENGTFDTTSTLNFRPESHHKSVECVSFLGGSEKVERRIIILYEETEVQSVSYIIWIALSCCIAGLIIFSNIVFWLKRKFGGLQIANLRTNTDFSLASLSPSIFRKTQKEVDVDGPKPPKLELPKIPTALEQPEYAGYDTEIPKSGLPNISSIQEELENREYETKLPKQRDSPEYETNLSKQSDNPEYETELLKPQSSKLPKLPKLPAIPKSSETSVYAECEFKDPPLESYSTSLNDVTQAKILYEKDMHKTKKIKMGKLYIRWMGTINVSSDNSKRVIFTTLTDEVFRLNKIHWDKFVKRVVQLPESRNLCKIEGIGIDNAKQYLIHQKLSFRLNERITATSKTDDGKTSRIPISPPEAIRFILGILEGMELIQSSGFLHPGLSTKKILLTNKRHCQLYDFCLEEDAMNVLSIRKPKMSYSLNELAPEGNEKNKYTSDSDVWSTAVVIWEILSGGLPPFHDENVKSTTFQTPPQTWPKDYQELSNTLLFECWDYNESLRPSIHELRLSFQKILKSVDTYNLPEVYGGSMAGWYVPMKEATKEIN